MKQIIYIIFTFSVLISCQTNNTAKTDKMNAEKGDLVGQRVESNQLANTKNDKSIFIKDSADYSIPFLKEMEKSGMKNVSLIDSFLIIGTKDTITFPSIPQIGKRTLFTAKSGELAIALTIERVNQTTIDYKIEMVEFGNANYRSKGQADLNPRFYLGEKTNESASSGISDLSTVFSDSRDTCYTHIRFGLREGSRKFLIGKIEKNCNGKLQDIHLDNYPRLSEK